MAKKSYFDGELNEFIDWIYGIDSTTGSSSYTKGLAASGYAIRNLLMDRLRHPLYIFKDTTENKYKFFSSQTAYLKWKAAIETGDARLEKELAPFFEIDRPAPYYVNVSDQSVSYPKYLIKGDIENAPLSIKPTLTNSAGITQNDSITAKFERKIGENTVDSFELNIDGAYVNNPNRPYTVNLFEFLKDGLNYFQVTLTADHEEAKEYSFFVTYYYIDFNISCDFNYAIGIEPNDVNGEENGYKKIHPTITVYKSINESARIKLYCDVNNQNVYIKDELFDGNQKTYQPYISTETCLPSENAMDDNGIEDKTKTHRRNCLKIHAELILGAASEEEGDLSYSTFSSNYLYYDFEVRAYSSGQELSNNFVNIYKSTNSYVDIEIDGKPEFALVGTQYTNLSFYYAYYSDTDITIAGLSSIQKDIIWKLEKVEGNEIEYEELGTTVGYNGQQKDPFVFTPTSVFDAKSNAYIVAYINDLQNNLVEVRRIPLIVNESPLQVQETDGYSLKLTTYGKSNEIYPDTWEDIKRGIKARFSTNFPFNNACGWNNNALTVKGTTNACIIPYNPFATNWYKTAETTELGCTVQIDFMTEDINSNDDILMYVGSSDYGIIIKPTAAQVVKVSTDPETGLSTKEVIIETNYKTNERLHLTFIFHPSTNTVETASLVYIVNNGILERAASYGGGESFVISTGNITIGGPTSGGSGIRVYGIRCYRKSITTRQALDNFIYDQSSNKAVLLNRNDLNNPISYTAASKILPTLLISGDLSQILDKEALKDQSESTVNITFINPKDKSKDFVLTNGRIRKHGQSTLNYPITSMKVWTNKVAEQDESIEGLVTTFECEAQEHFDLNKNRYIMKTNTSLGKRSVPINKFVLQANYADSSGVHNGGILRLINDTWFKAQVKFANSDNKEYKLRNNPQLFSSNAIITHNDEAINERAGWETQVSTEQDTYDDGTSYLKNVYTKSCRVFRRTEQNPQGSWVTENIETVNVMSGIEGYNDQGKQWNNYSVVNGVATDFPYTIRTGPDSFPCAVFYENTKDPSQAGNYRFLGTYVFMDDKKSDFVFGERSIFGNRQGTGFLNSDPFCLTNSQKDDDISNNRVWNNKHVLRIECVLVNTKLTSFMDYFVSSNVTLDQDPESPTYGEYIETGDPVLCDDIKYEKGQPSKYYWEDYFEMIYPDPDDIKGHNIGDPKKNGGVYDKDTTKFGAHSEFKKTAQPFVDLLYWIGDLGRRNTRTGVAGGERLLGGEVNPTILEEFKQTASAHLDLYKLAAYYIFFLRFGLVDSVERNGQWKTYDGIHWHLEPWDMDIALGNKNDGGIAFQPPMTRDSRMPDDNTKYAYSGRSSTTSNFLWDCLEAWDHWSEVIVPNVAQALYDAGLTYDNISDMFDNEYVAQWPEHMYNESGTFKYVTMRGTENGWLAWLQGARTSHRHWWLSTSMNYYDAKWSCGDFNNHRVYIAADKTLGVPGVVKIKPVSETYFKLTIQDGTNRIPGYNEAAGPQNTEATVHATKGYNAIWDITNQSFAVKDPAHIFGATFIEELDVSAFATGMTSLTLGGAYDKVLGASIKVLNIGVPFYSNAARTDQYLVDFDTIDTNVTTTLYGSVSGAKLNLSGSSSKKSILNMEEDDSDNSTDALKNLITLNINGQKSVKDTDSLLKNNDRRNIENFYAIGTAMTRFVNAPGGNKFNKLFLPASMTGNVGASNITSLTFNDCSWNNLTFWNTSVSGNTEYIETDDGAGGIIRYEAPNPAVFTKTGVPASIVSITYNGSTATYQCSAKLFRDYVDSIETVYNNSVRDISTQTLYNNLREAWIINDKLLDEAWPIEDPTTNTRKTIADNGTSAYLYNLLIDETTTLSREEVIEIGLFLYIKDKYQFNARNINWDETCGITFKYLKRLAFFNNGTNAGTLKPITGYIQMAGNEHLSANQLSQLSTWFGNAVFDINSIKTSLVIDHGQNYLAISVGTGSFIEDNKIFVNESDKISNRVVIKANKFTLRKDITGLNYKWTVYDENNNISSKVSIVTNKNTGVSYIYAKEGNGTGGDYKVTIRADYYEDPAMIEIGGGSADHGEIEVWIRPVTRPTGWNVTFKARGNSTGIRVLNALPAIFSEFFGDSNKTHVINGFEFERPNYILYGKGLEYEVVINPIGENSNATINSLGWTIENINLGNRGFESFTKVGDPPLLSYSTTSESQLALGDTNPITFAKQNDEDILYYKKDSSQGMKSGIVIGTYENKTWDFNYKAFKITCTIGYTVPERFIINILVIDDSKPLLRNSDQKAIYNKLINKIINSGGIKQSTDDLYKVDLMCVDGNIVIDGNDANVTMPYNGLEVNATPNSVFYYLPNVTGVKIHNCPNLAVPEEGEETYFNFENMTKLKALSLVNLSSNSVGTLDLTNNSELEYINTKQTKIGVKLPYSIKAVELGNPTQIYIANTSEFDIQKFSVEGTSQLKSLDIIGVNRESGTNNAYSYKLLYKLATKPTVNTNSTDYFNVSNEVYIWYIPYEDTQMSNVLSSDSGGFNKHYGCCWYQSQLSSLRGKKINIIKFKAKKAGTFNIYKTTNENSIANNRVATITIDNEDINNIIEKHINEFILNNNEYLVIGKYGENIIEYDQEGHSSIVGVSYGDTAEIYYKSTSGPGFYSNIKYDNTTPNWDITWQTNANCELNIGVGYYYVNN